MAQHNRTTIQCDTDHLKRFASTLGFTQRRGQAYGEPSVSRLMQAINDALTSTSFCNDFEHLMRDHEVTGDHDD